MAEGIMLLSIFTNPCHAHHGLCSQQSYFAEDQLFLVLICVARRQQAPCALRNTYMQTGEYLTAQYTITTKYATKENIFVL